MTRPISYGASSLMRESFFAKILKGVKKVTVLTILNSLFLEGLIPLYLTKTRKPFLLECLQKNVSIG